MHTPNLCLRSEWYISLSPLSVCAHIIAFSLELEGVAECMWLQCWCSHRGRWEVSLQEMWSLGKWSVTKFIVMPHFRTKSASKLLAQKQTQNQIPMTSSHSETGDLTHNEEHREWLTVCDAEYLKCWMLVSCLQIPFRSFTMQLLEKKPVWLQIDPSLVSLLIIFVVYLLFVCLLLLQYSKSFLDFSSLMILC